jgi:ribosomal protein S18 acetylase RimI-like enzyme
MTVSVRTADATDLPFLRGADSHISKEQLGSAVEEQRVLVAEKDASRVGFLRWGLFWDEIPFMHLLYVAPAHRGAGIGTRQVTAWEEIQRAAGYRVVLTSTSAAERAQHLYRRLGYVDSGCLLLPGEATEIVLRKALEVDAPSELDGS